MELAFDIIFSIVLGTNVYVKEHSLFKRTNKIEVQAD